jgi:hypothetical protein
LAGNAWAPAVSLKSPMAKSPATAFIDLLMPSPQTTEPRLNDRAATVYLENAADGFTESGFKLATEFLKINIKILLNGATCQSGGASISNRQGGHGWLLSHQFCIPSMTIHARFSLTNSSYPLGQY